jgi:thiol-disulfide isomerase/thioredoxin
MAAEHPGHSIDDSTGELRPENESAATPAIDETVTATPEVGPAPFDAGGVEPDDPVQPPRIAADTEETPADAPVAVLVSPATDSAIDRGFTVPDPMGDDVVGDGPFASQVVDATFEVPAAGIEADTDRQPSPARALAALFRNFRRRHASDPFDPSPLGHGPQLVRAIVLILLLCFTVLGFIAVGHSPQTETVAVVAPETTPAPASAPAATPVLRAKSGAADSLTAHPRFTRQQLVNLLFHEGLSWNAAAERLVGDSESKRHILLNPVGFTLLLLPTAPADIPLPLQRSCDGKPVRCVALVALAQQPASDFSDSEFGAVCADYVACFWYLRDRATVDAEASHSDRGQPPTAVLLDAAGEPVWQMRLDDPSAEPSLLAALGSAVAIWKRPANAAPWGSSPMAAAAAAPTASREATAAASRPAPPPAPPPPPTANPAARPTGTAWRSTSLQGVYKGNEATLGRLVRQGPVLVDFWGTYCQACIEEFPLLEQLRAANPKLQVIGIVDANPSGGDLVRKILKSKRVEFPQYFAPVFRPALQELCGTSLLPAAAIFDHNGKFAQCVLGSLKDPTNRGKLDALVLEVAPPAGRPPRPHATTAPVIATAGSAAGSGAPTAAVEGGASGTGQRRANRRNSAGTAGSLTLQDLKRSIYAAKGPRNSLANYAAYMARDENRIVVVMFTNSEHWNTLGQTDWASLHVSLPTWGRSAGAATLPVAVVRYAAPTPPSPAGGEAAFTSTRVIYMDFEKEPGPTVVELVLGKVPVGSAYAVFAPREGRLVGCVEGSLQSPGVRHALEELIERAADAN